MTKPRKESSPPHNQNPQASTSNLKSFQMPYSLSTDAELNGKGTEAFQRGNYTEAVECFKELIELRDEQHGTRSYLSCAARYKMGLSLLRLDDNAYVEAAWEQLQTCLSSLTDTEIPDEILKVNILSALGEAALRKGYPNSHYYFQRAISSLGSMPECSFHHMAHLMGQSLKDIIPSKYKEDCEKSLSECQNQLAQLLTEPAVSPLTMESSLLPNIDPSALPEKPNISTLHQIIRSYIDIYHIEPIAIDDERADQGLRKKCIKVFYTWSEVVLCCGYTFLLFWLALFVAVAILVANTIKWLKQNFHFTWELFFACLILIFQGVAAGLNPKPNNKHIYSYKAFYVVTAIAAGLYFLFRIIKMILNVRNKQVRLRRKTGNIGYRWLRKSDGNIYGSVSEFFGFVATFLTLLGSVAECVKRYKEIPSSFNVPLVTLWCAVGAAISASIKPSPSRVTAVLRHPTLGDIGMVGHNIEGKLTFNVASSDDLV